MHEVIYIVLNVKVKVKVLLMWVLACVVFTL